MFYFHLDVGRMGYKDMVLPVQVFLPASLSHGSDEQLARLPEGAALLDTLRSELPALVSKFNLKSADSLKQQTESYHNEKVQFSFRFKETETCYSLYRTQSAAQASSGHTEQRHGDRQQYRGLFASKHTLIISDLQLVPGKQQAVARSVETVDLT
eukprot:g60710.t1